MTNMALFEMPPYEENLICTDILNGDFLSEIASFMCKFHAYSHTFLHIVSSLDEEIHTAIFGCKTSWLFLLSI